MAHDRTDLLKPRVAPKSFQVAVVWDTPALVLVVAKDSVMSSPSGTTGAVPQLAPRISTTTSDERLNARALRLFMSCRYRPATLGGAPVPAWVEQPIHFS